MLRQSHSNSLSKYKKKKIKEEEEEEEKKKKKRNKEKYNCFAYGNKVHAFEQNKLKNHYKKNTITES